MTELPALPTRVFARVGTFNLTPAVECLFNRLTPEKAARLKRNELLWVALNEPSASDLSFAQCTVLTPAPGTKDDLVIVRVSDSAKEQRCYYGQLARLEREDGLKQLLQRHPRAEGIRVHSEPRHKPDLPEPCQCNK